MVDEFDDVDPEQLSTLLTVKGGRFIPKPIVGDSFTIIPKAFNPALLANSLVLYRRRPVEAIFAKVLKSSKNSNDPGVFLRGLADGVGKSIVTYTIAQVCKFHLGWLTIYLPNCKDWGSLGKLDAKAFFLDRVVEAFSPIKIQEKFPVLFATLTDFPTKSRSWAAAAERDPNACERQLINAFVDVKEFLNNTNVAVPVLLIFEEVNGLWENSVAQVSKARTDPWNLTSFELTPRIARGCLLVSGTTDSEFTRTIKDGLEHTIYNVGKLDSQELLEPFIETKG